MRYGFPVLSPEKTGLAPARKVDTLPSIVVTLIDTKGIIFDATPIWNFRGAPPRSPASEQAGIWAEERLACARGQC